MGQGRDTDGAVDTFACVNMGADPSFTQDIYTELCMEQHLEPFRQEPINLGWL